MSHLRDLWLDRYLTRVSLVFFGALAVLVLCLVTRVEADAIEVSHPDSNEIQRLQLEKGYDADIIVYLMSFGDPVDKYLVTLRKESNNKRMGALLSDRHGRVLFRGVKPGKYHVEVSRRLREDGQVSTVAIGDIRLRVAEGGGL